MIEQGRTTVADMEAERRRGPAGPARKRTARSVLVPLAIGVMLLGYAMMFQPFALAIFTYSYTVILIGTALYIVASHLPE